MDDVEPGTFLLRDHRDDHRTACRKMRMGSWGGEGHEDSQVSLFAQVTGVERCR